MTPANLSGFSNKTKVLSMLSSGPTILLANKQKYFLKLRYKILSTVTIKYSKLSTDLHEEVIKTFSYTKDRHHCSFDMKFLNLDNCRINCSWKLFLRSVISERLI
jgi:hypothetical protein